MVSAIEPSRYSAQPPTTSAVPSLPDTSTHTASARQASAVPMNRAMNAGMTAVRLICCIAWMPWDSGRRPSPGITKLEKA